MIVLVCLALILLAYFYATKNHDYWAKRNVKHDKPIPLLGNHFKNQIGAKSITTLFSELYNKYPEEKVVGYYRGTTPELIVRDLEIARHILNVDFAYFYPRGLGRNPEYEPVLKNVFHVDGDTWKLLRQRLTPAFTTAKLKAMFPLIVACAEKLQLQAAQAADRGGPCDVRELMARFTTEFIGACGFGIQMDTINDEQSLYRDFGKRIFTRSSFEMLKLAIYELFPDVRDKFAVMNRDIEVIITEIVKKIRQQRNFKPSGRNDFIDLLLELEGKGKIEGDSIEHRKADGTPERVELDFDLSLMAAQVFIFFAAGFETSSSATSFTLHKLAFHPEIQEKIQNEIDQVLTDYDNKLCYDAVSKLSLLDAAFKESMRMFPSLGNLHRVCAKRYTIPDLNITIDPGVKIGIPIQAIQNDAKYFDNPTEFRPERFSPDNEKNQHKYTYMPFGEGPRACIGARLGQMQSLAGLAAVLQKFSVEPAANTLEVPLLNHKSNIVQSIQGGLPLKLTFRKIKTI